MRNEHRATRRTQCLLTATLSFLVASCGGGGGGGSGGGGSNPPPSGPGDTEGFFPDAVGNAWYYDVTASEPVQSGRLAYLDSVEVTGSRTVSGRQAKVFVETNAQDSGLPLENYYARDLDGVTYLGNGDPTDTVTRAIVPYLEARFPVTVGTIDQRSANGVDFGDDLDGDGRNETVDLDLRISMSGFEALDLAIGSFDRTAHRVADLTGTVRFTSLGQSVPFTSRQDLWSTPGIGVIRERISVTIEGMTLEDNYVARGYVVDGVARGLGLPFALLNNLAPSGSQIDPPGRPSLASDGTSYLAVTTRAVPVQSGTPMVQLVGSRFDANGNVVGEFDVTPLEAAYSAYSTALAFDGANYLLVYTPSSYPSLPPLRAQRIAPDGTLLDGSSDLVTDGGNWPASAAGPANSLVVYTRFDNTTNQHLLYGVLVSPAGAVDAPGEIPIAIDDSTHLFPAVGFDGQNFLVVWQQQPASGSNFEELDIRGVRVTQAGAALDASPLEIASAIDGQSMPSVACGSASCLVVWLDGRNFPGTQGFPDVDIYATRVSQAGEVLDGPAASGGIRITSGAQPRRDVTVGFTGSSWRVTWAAGDYVQTDLPIGIMGARVASDGFVIGSVGAGAMLSGPPSPATLSRYTSPAVARGPDGAAVVWVHNAGAAATNTELLAVIQHPY